jgi:acetoin utilization deacetylase AcuC-like enzyme
MTTGLVYDPIFLQHVNPEGHPERVERLAAISDRLQKSGLQSVLSPIPARQALPEELGLVHTASYVDNILKLTGRSGYLDSDTYVSPQSVTAALMAAGGAVALAEAVWRGELRNGIALLRPPGHHAEANRAMGFCLFNNVAVAAAGMGQAGAARVGN